jgi:HAD superfamily hydrolase (TIGR01509 family)
MNERLYKPGEASGTPARPLVDLSQVQTVIFDMDGTILDSRLPWPQIRSALELGADLPLIDALNALPDGEREARWAKMRDFEDWATESAELFDGVTELLALLAERGYQTALVTNNSQRNLERVVSRWRLRFDAILSRDSGYYKPGPGPLLRVLGLIGASAGRALAVGNSRQDLISARQAGCGSVAIVHAAGASFAEEADLRFETFSELHRFVRVTGTDHREG